MSSVRYLEIPVSQMHRAIEFYQAVFDVVLKPTEVDGYSMARFPPVGDGRGADIALAQGDVYLPSKSGPIVYFHVDDIDAVLRRARARGAEILLAKKDIGSDGFVAEFEDSEGNRIALSQSRR